MKVFAHIVFRDGAVIIKEVDKVEYKVEHKLISIRGFAMNAKKLFVYLDDTLIDSVVVTD